MEKTYWRRTQTLDSVSSAGNIWNGKSANESILCSRTQKGYFRNGKRCAAIGPVSFTRTS